MYAKSSAFHHLDIEHLDNLRNLLENGPDAVVILQSLAQDLKQAFPHNFERISICLVRKMLKLIDISKEMH